MNIEIVIERFRAYAEEMSRENDGCLTADMLADAASYAADAASCEPDVVLDVLIDNGFILISEALDALEVM